LHRLDHATPQLLGLLRRVPLIKAGGHLWPDSDESTRAVTAVSARRADLLRTEAEGPRLKLQVSCLQGQSSAFNMNVAA
jgi:hypothetical protein